MVTVLMENKDSDLVLGHDIKRYGLAICLKIMVGPIENLDNQLPKKRQNDQTLPNSTYDDLTKSKVNNRPKSILFTMWPHVGFTFLNEFVRWGMMPSDTLILCHDNGRDESTGGK